MRRSSALLAVLFASACAEEGAPIATEPLAVVSSPGGPGEILQGPRGTYVLTDDPSTDIASSAPMHRILYLNFDGGTYTPGSNNSSTNRSSIVSSTSTIAPWGSASARAAVTACVQDLFSPFNITVTTTDPGDTVHIEAVTAGRPQDVGMGSGVGGVSPFSCGIIERSIVFNFAEVYGSSYQSLCETVGQEAVHSFGLDHEYLCKDPMTYLGGCGKKTFQDVNAQCGEYSARNCQCGGGTQNSYQELMAALGPAGPGIPPDVRIDEPSNGATVNPGFHVTVSATDDVAVDRVELFIDGALSSTVSVPPYVFDTPASITPGAHNVEARAYDSGGVNSHMISVNVADTGGGPECETNDDCPAGFVCNAAGNCEAEGGGGGGDCTAVGCACDDAADCASGLCLSNGSESYCSERCDMAADSCPDGTECVPTTGDDAVCWPGGSGGDDGDDVAGGCRVGDSDGAGAAWLLLAMFGILRRRRCRTTGPSTR